MLVAGRIGVIVDLKAESFELLTVPFPFSSYLLSRRCLFILAHSRSYQSGGVFSHLARGANELNVHAGSIYLHHVSP